MRLHPAAAAAGYRLLSQDTLGSTNAKALMLARGGERDQLWITAQRQTAGRGRRGNEWVSQPGNLYATLLLRDPASAEYAPQLSFVACMAVHDAILDVAPSLRERLRLKWPNDLLLGGAKFAGILVEGERIEQKLTVAVGIGINCAHHPDHTAYPATDLGASGAAISAEAMFEALSAGMSERLAQWRRGAGFAAIRADWIACAVGIGGDMRVRLPGGELSGRMEALDEQGRLLLRLSDGTVQAIAAGEVFPLEEKLPAGALATGRTD
jgi:BirA family transcriptional regulator, biotin operon repressor / biotin---[acetyl-CoA-carboxylase] ligase